MRVPFFVFFFAAGQAEKASAKKALQGGAGFRCGDQSRIAGVCREIRWSGI
jgi:hypothetical protein